MNVAVSGTGVLTRTFTRQSSAGAVVLIAAGLMAIVMSRTEAILAPLWLLGVAAGFTLQRSRFCFASAFRDIFLFGHSRIMKGVLVGLAVATTGFAIIMYDKVPFPASGVLPEEAHILPVGISVILGGLLFGFGMVLSGGCVSGSLYRMGEGYVGSWISVAGVIIGLGILSQTWNWWWRVLVSNESRAWMPSSFSLGYGGGVLVTLGGLLAIFLFLLWWESRSGLSEPEIPLQGEPWDTFLQKLLALWRSIFGRGWSAMVGGGVLGGIAVLMYMVHMPWGITGELTRWANVTMSTLGFAPPAPLGLSDIGGCAARAEETGVFTHTFAVTVSLLPGSLIGALLAGEFKLRFPRSAKRYLQSLGGGVLMGLGAGLAIGCTIGAFFSSIPSLSISGWLFAAALAGGAFVGTRALRLLS